MKSCGTELIACLSEILQSSAKLIDFLQNNYFCHLNLYFIAAQDIVFSDTKMENEEKHFNLQKINVIVVSIYFFVVLSGLGTGNTAAQENKEQIIHTLQKLISISFQAVRAAGLFPWMNSNFQFGF